MSKIPSAEDFFKKYRNLYQFEEGSPEYLIDGEDFQTAMIEYAKIHVEAALKEASNKALIQYGYDEEGNSLAKNPVYDDDYKYDNFDSYPTMEIQKQSILNAYPMYNIK